MKTTSELEKIAMLESLVLDIVQANNAISVDELMSFISGEFSEEDVKYVIRRLVERGALKFNDDMLLEVVV